jgi:hypothetical protein
MDSRTRKRVVVGGIASAAVLTGALLTGGHGHGDHLSTRSLPPASALNPAVTQQTIAQTICVHGWTATIRPPASYTTRLKVQQMYARGLKGGTQDYEEDHAVSLELGGNPTDESNLFPEAIGVARQDDQVENRLNEQVCRGDVTLAKARQQIWTLKKEHGL